MIEEARDGSNEIENIRKLLKEQLKSRFKNLLGDKMFIVAALFGPARSNLLDAQEGEIAKSELVKMVKYTIFILTLIFLGRRNYLNTRKLSTFFISLAAFTF